MLPTGASSSAELAVLEAECKVNALALAICLRDRALFVSETARMLPTGASSSAELAVSEAECKVNALA
jgi:proline racemase